MKTWFSILILTASAWALTAQTPGTESIGWKDIESRVRNHEAVRQALIVKNLRSQFLLAETGWQGPRINLTPSVQYSDPEGTMAHTQTALGADLVIPLGVTEAEREKKIQAREAFDLSDTELRTAYGQAYLELFNLYMSAYLAQEMVGLAAVEAELARLKADTTRQRVSQGLLPVSEQTDTESEYQAAAEKLIQSRLDLRLAWLNLAYAADLETPRAGRMQSAQVTPGDPVGAVPKFQAPETDVLVRDAPQPGRLMAVAKANSAAVAAQKQKLDRARRDLSYQATVDLDFLPKISYATPDISASLGYSTANGSITTGSSWNIYKNDKLSSGGSQPPDHALILSLGISAAISGVGASERRALTEAAALEERRLVFLEQSLDLQIRARYAAFLKARDSVAEAERAEKAARETALTVQARGKVGQLSPEDEAANEVLLARTAFNLQKARIGLSQAYLGVIGSANAWDLIGQSFGAK
jgi:outer membrane protein TolC